MGLTLAQQQAVEARGNVLVIAGAGTGKTSTLVERCLNCLLEENPPASLDQILMVTFTDAAAADMRMRIRQRLEHELEQEQAKDRALAASKSTQNNPRHGRARGPGQSLSQHWQEQLALFETAHIGTLHSFCLKLIRQHFYELELDPQLSVLPEEEASLLADETIEDILQKHYAGTSTRDNEVQRLIQTQGGGFDRVIRALVLRLHHYAQTLPNPAGWLATQLNCFESQEPVLWENWLRQGLIEWRGLWLPALEQDLKGTPAASACASALRRLQRAPSETDFAEALAAIMKALEDCPQALKKAPGPMKDFAQEAEFLFSLTTRISDDERAGSATPPLAEDWNWVRGQMKTLLELTREFTDAFSHSKHELGVVDYHDLEQYALRLLWDREANRPTAAASQWRDKLRFVFVDEYQDINAAQDRIIEALCREGERANLFLVGDVKQSVYRFRLANPRIFQNYAAAWQDPPDVAKASGAPKRGPKSGRSIPLVDNFRSREGVLRFVNSVFRLVMRAELGGVAYDEQAQLRFGAPTERSALSLATDPDPCVELHLHVQNGGSGNESETEQDEVLAEVEEMERAGKEARLLALRLLELKARRHRVWDEKSGRSRQVEWSDMAVLLRAPSNKADTYAREFARLEVPLLVARGGFYQSLEVSDLLNLLRLLDNPLQDLPLLAVLRSPLVGLTLSELATIRLTNKGTFWNALVHWSRSRLSGISNLKFEISNPADASGTWLRRKIAAFLERYARWRRLVRQVSLTRCLDTVLAETHYADWVRTQARGDQRCANLQRLSGLARQFDQFQRQGLFRFLHFIEAQQRADSEPAVAPVNPGNAVRLMSIHQSKGLEFPVVAVADLAKLFNLADLRADIILDEEYGLCPRVTPPHTGQSYPSLPYWLARRRQTRELLGEELRLLYVAMTRARDTLLLSASITEKRFRNHWRRAEEAVLSALVAARSYADWLGLWFAQNVPATAENATQGESSGLRWFIHGDARLVEPGAALAPEMSGRSTQISTNSSAWRTLQQRLSWTYPHLGATRQAAKTSVSLLRRQAAEFADDEAALVVPERGFVKTRKPKADLRAKAEGRRPKDTGGQIALPLFPGEEQGAATGVAASEPPRHEQASATDVGTAHHTFLQYVSLERADSLDALRAEAQRLQHQGLLTADQAALLDFDALAAFWKSDLGRRVRAQAQFVRRELPFTARFLPQELAALVRLPSSSKLDDEFVVVQGVADLVVLLPNELWLVDFKTDILKPTELPARVKVYEPQLQLYSQALARIHCRAAAESWLYFLACRQAVRV